jgi:hypothetical protein
MKTIKEAIMNELYSMQSGGCIPNPEDDNFERGFIEGVKFAQRWISVKEELPQKDNIYLVKWTNLLGQKSFELVGFSTKENNWEAKYFECVTHWRHIELK